ncbi:MAG TPA: hypothetical protein DEP18_08185 [Flavobacteriales bacterium]|nr:hypothetical protein [Flavobacteriales bacterium]HCA83752.1 hypothetical protein [Flavobacteriales bacterium]HRE75205.1 PaaI family thioesterase [Flavobacteriales bacterium]HRJ36730.1 PaaI family thioesterase [Flavobacteriales bacterium]HRJ39282.1 PaaI family thioesterase [Flavobacteriales bacterium]
MEMQQIIDEYIKANHFGRLLNMEFQIQEPGKIIYTLPSRKELLATETAMHGGALAAFMDAILGVAALSAVAGEGKRVATLELKISFLQAVPENDLLTGYGTVLKKGNRIVFSEGEIRNQNNEIIAKGSGTFTAYPIAKS